MQGDVMKMRELAEGLEIPAGATVALAPGGYHIMFMGLNQAFVEGESITITLVFEKAGSVEVELPVLGTAADSAGHGAMEMDHDASQDVAPMMDHGALNSESTN